MRLKELSREELLKLYPVKPSSDGPLYERVGLPPQPRQSTATPGCR